MGWPGDGFTDPPEDIGAILGVKNIVSSALTAVDLGPVEISDTSQGLEAQTWRGNYDGALLTLTADNLATRFIPLDVNIDSLDITFDQNGDDVIVYSKQGDLFIRWFRPGTGITVQALGEGTTPICQLDLRPVTLQSTSDVIVVYVRAGEVRMRKQRDLFEIEYTATNLNNPNMVIRRAGVSDRNRFQIEITSD